jgi:hypothetical protein
VAGSGATNKPLCVHCDETITQEEKQINIEKSFAKSKNEKKTGLTIDKMHVKQINNIKTKKKNQIKTKN